MRADGSIDLDSFEKFIDWQITEGIQGLVPCGTTGESPTLTMGEQGELIRTAVRTAEKRVPIIAGAGANSTAEAIELSHIAQSAGADALLQVVPYYNKPSQRGIYAHFKAIHDATDLPIILYNVPGRTVANMSIDTQTALSELPRIVGVKDATNDLHRVGQTRAASGDDFIQLTGEDANVLHFLQLGGHGAISVTSNIAPRLCANLFNAHARGDGAEAARIHMQLMPLHDAMFVKVAGEEDPSPCQVKYAAAQLGLIEENLRLPMVPAGIQTRRAVDIALHDLRNAYAQRPGGVMPQLRAVMG